MKSVNTCLVIVAGILLSACASHEFMTLEARAEGEPTKVNPLEDNKAVLERSQPALVGVLNVKGDVVTLGDMVLVSVPRQGSKPAQGEQISIKGWANGQEVSAVSIESQELNAHENTGMVLVSERQLHFALPFTQPIESLSIQLPGDKQPVRVSVREELRKLCEAHKKLEACQYKTDIQ